MKLFGSSRRAETLPNIIMLTGILAAALLTLFWIGQHVDGSHVKLEIHYEDLQDIQLEVARACSAYLYRSSFNPQTDVGFLYINETTACLGQAELYRCVDLLCPVDYTETLELSEHERIEINGQNGLVRVGGYVA